MIRSKARSLFFTLLAMILAACGESTAPAPKQSYVATNDTATVRFTLRKGGKHAIWLSTTVVGEVEFADGRHQFKVNDDRLATIARGPYLPEFGWDDFAQLPMRKYGDGLTVAALSRIGTLKMTVWHKSDAGAKKLVIVDITEFWPGCASLNGYSFVSGIPCDAEWW